MAKRPTTVKSVQTSTNNIIRPFLDLSFVNSGQGEGPKSVFIHSIIASIQKPVAGVVAVKLEIGAASTFGLDAATVGIYRTYHKAVAAEAFFVQLDFREPLEFLFESTPFMLLKCYDNTTPGTEVMSATAANYSLIAVVSYA